MNATKVYSRADSDLVMSAFLAGATDAQIAAALGRTSDSIRRRRMTMGIQRQPPIVQAEPAFQPIEWDHVATDLDTMRRYAAAHKIAPTVAAVNAFRRGKSVPEWTVVPRWAA